MELINKIITIDGPSGVGKGTVAKYLAESFGCEILDSGAIYRTLALDLLNKKINPTALDKVITIAENLDLSFQVKNNNIIVILNGKDVTTEIRSEQVGDFASQIASIPEVRTALLQRQRDFANNNINGLVADGRDMGSIVFPNADFKIFLDASSEERAKRRYKQLQESKINVKFDKILQDIIARDYRDRNRSIAPLKATADALVIDSTDLSLQQVINLVLDYIGKK